MTLTNWERLNNAPILLPNASAVQWNDFLFVLARDGTALVYHNKLKLWSMLPSYSKSLSDNVPLVNYNGQILTVTSYGQIIAFNTSSSDWTTISGPPEDAIYIIIQDNTLYTYSKPSSMSCFSMDTSPFSLYSLTTNGWKEHDNITIIYDVNLVLSTSEHFFEKVGNEIYCRKIAKTPETEPETVSKVQPKQIARPPYNDFTLHVIKDTLFSFGGRDRDNQPTSDVLRYNLDTDTWESAGYMRSCRYNVAVTTMRQGDTTEVYVLGGELGSNKFTMKPKLNIASKVDKASGNWNCSTSIVEKCTLLD